MEKRIDLDEAKEIMDEHDSTSEIIAELKRMYKREDELLDALRIIRDDLNEAISKGSIAIHATHGIDVTKIRNFANDASL